MVQVRPNDWFQLRPPQVATASYKKGTGADTGRSEVLCFNRRSAGRHADMPVRGEAGKENTVQPNIIEKNINKTSQAQELSHRFTITKKSKQNIPQINWFQSRIIPYRFQFSFGFLSVSRCLERENDLLKSLIEIELRTGFIGHPTGFQGNLAQ